MFYSSVLLAVTAFTASVSAQNYSTSGNLTIDGSQIPVATRQAWCVGQRNACPYLCDGSTSANDCDPDALTYSCVCSGSQTPNISDYSQTLPAFICEQWVANCVDNHPDDLPGITACRSVTCGMKNATALGANSTGSGSGGSDSTTAPSTTSAASTSAAATTAAATTSAAPTGAAIALGVAQSYGTAIFSAAILGLFGLAL